MGSGLGPRLNPATSYRASWGYAQGGAAKPRRKHNQEFEKRQTSAEALAVGVPNFPGTLATPPPFWKCWFAKSVKGRVAVDVPTFRLR